MIPTFMLGAGAKLLARPALLAGIVSVVGLGAGALYHVKVTDGARERYIERLEAENASQMATIAKQDLALSKEREFATVLQRQIDNQNARINELALKAKTVELAAGLAASQAFSKGLAAAKSLAAPTTTVKPGHEAMNQWLKERFGGAP